MTWLIRDPWAIGEVSRCRTTYRTGLGDGVWRLAAGGSLSVVSREGSDRPDAMAITSLENGICRTGGLRKNFVHGAKLLRWMRQRG